MTIFYPATTRQSLRPGLIHHSAGRNPAPAGSPCLTSGHAAAVPATDIGVMESRLIRMVAVPLMAGRIRPCLPELRSDERMSLPLTPIDASPPGGLTLDTIGALLVALA